MNIMMAITSNLLEIAQVMLFSLFSNNDVQIDVYLLHHELDMETIDELKKVADLFDGKRIIPIEIGDVAKEYFPTSSDFSVEVWYKFIGVNYLPQELNRVLWLDADIVVTGSILDYYDVDMGDKYIAACEDINAIINAMDVGIKTRIGMDLNKPYYNAGIVLFNLENVKKQYFIDKIIALLEKGNINLEYNEQDAMNILFGENIYCVPWRLYNIHPGCYTLDVEKAIEGKVKYITYRERVVYSNQENYKGKFIDVTDIMIKNAKIIHYVGSSKPWRFELKKMHWAHIPFRKPWEDYKEALEKALSDK